MLSILAPLRRRLALTLAPELAPNTAPYDGPTPVFRSVRGKPTSAPDGQTVLVAANTPGGRLAAFRRALGLSRSAFAEALGVLPRTISDVETDGRQPPRSLLLAAASKFDLSADWLLRGVGEPKSHETLSPKTGGLNMTKLSRLDPDDHLLAKVRAGFVLKGTSLHAWCVAQGIDTSSASKALSGQETIGASHV